jgi:hypothetical protein
MFALLSALVLAAAPTEPATPSKPTPRVALWAQPVGTVVSGLTGGPVYIPVGANVPLSGSTSLGLELSLVYGSMREPEDEVLGAAPLAFWRVLAAVGPVFSLRDEPLSGPFLQPKVIALYSREPDYAFEALAHQGGSSLELQLGLDVGWQFSFGDWYVAPVVGVSAGYCFDCSVDGDATFEPSHFLAPRVYGYSTRRDSRAVVGLNLNLLRAGTRF